MTSYGVFSQGQIWMLSSSKGWARGYLTRAGAVAAAAEALSIEGPEAQVTLLLQDETGFVNAPDIGLFLARDAT